MVDQAHSFSCQFDAVISFYVMLIIYIHLWDMSILVLVYFGATITYPVVFNSVHFERIWKVNRSILASLLERIGGTFPMHLLDCHFLECCEIK